MKILSLNFEIVRATPNVAEFLVRVELDSPTAGCEVTGRAVGPRCEEISTVEVAYPMTVTGVSDTAVTLRCVIPEPNLWTPDAPFIYAVMVELRVKGNAADARGGTVALRGRQSPPT
jgi:hypothetical protein